MTTIPSIETATAIPPAPQTAWTPLPAVVDGRIAVLVFAGERTPCAAAPAACPLAEVAAFPAALEAIAAAPLAPSETAPPVASEAGRAVSMKPPRGTGKDAEKSEILTLPWFAEKVHGDVVVSVSGSA